MATIDKNIEENVNTVDVSGETVNETRSFEPAIYVTFDNQDPKNRVKIFNAHNSAVSLTSVGEKPFKIVDVLAEVGTRARSNSVCQNTYLFTDDGNVFFTQSNGIAKTTNELVEMVKGDFKANTSNGYVVVRLAVSKLSGGRSYKQLQLIEA